MRQLKTCTVDKWVRVMRRPRRWLPEEKGWWWVWCRGAKYLLSWWPGKGICLVGRIRVVTKVVSPVWSDLKRRWPRMAIRKRKSDVNGVTNLVEMSSKFFSDLLPLIEHCSARQYDDGSPRAPGWFTVKTQGSAWVCQVKDPDTCCSFTSVAATIDQALETAALMLASDEAPWERDTFLEGMKAREKKK